MRKHSKMKNRLNITVDDALVERAKQYANKHNTSLSQLVEKYFKSITRSADKKNILELLSELPKPKTKIQGDLKTTYYNAKKKKYGF